MKYVGIAIDNNVEQELQDIIQPISGKVMLYQDKCRVYGDEMEINKDIIMTAIYRKYF